MQVGIAVHIPSTNSPRLPNMLRTRLSSGALRAQAHASLQLSTAHPVPAIPAQFARTSQRGLASAVLLSSRENWQSRTVKNLKEALVQRGLPQYGNKKALVARLEEYEAKSTISATTSSAYARNTSSGSSARHISSSAIRSAEASNPASEDPVGETTTPTAQVLTDAEVNIQNVAKPEAADPSTVPGVPEEKAQAIDVAEPAYIGAVEIPVYEEKPDQLAIPVSFTLHRRKSCCHTEFPVFSLSCRTTSKLVPKARWLLRPLNPMRIRCQRSFPSPRILRITLVTRCTRR